MPQDLLKEFGRDPAVIHSGSSVGFKDPVVSFCCPTYGTIARKPHLLQEVVYWYRRQTYPHRELLILNDAPGQKIHIPGLLRAEGVRVVNMTLRAPTLGEKRNLMTMMAIGSIILPQDDDDISLPWRAEQAVKMLQTADYWSPRRWWYYQVGRSCLEAVGNGVGHNCSAFRRAAFYNRYPAITMGEDLEIDKWAMSGAVKVNREILTEDDDISYVYRWGVNDRHISGYGNRAEEAFTEFDAGPDGDYELVDGMDTDWVEAHNAQIGEPT